MYCYVAPDKDAPPGSGPGDATPSSRLREYLARPERTGRRPVVLDGSRPSQGALDADAPGGEEADVDESVRGRKHGRKSRR